MKKSKGLLGLFLSIMLMLSFTACGNSNKTDQTNGTNNSAAESTKKSTTKTITDMDGKTVTIPVDITKVGSSIGAINQIILMLGSPEKVVATIPGMKSNPWYEKIYPNIKDTATPFSTKPNVEEVIASKPQVIFSHVGSATTADSMKETKIPVITLNINNPENLKKSVMIIGKALGTKEEKKAKQFCDYYDANVKSITDKTKSLSTDKKVKVFLAGAATGGGMPLSTEGKDSIVTSWIEQAGGINVAAEGGVVGMGKQVSMEDVIKWNPDVIVTTTLDSKNRILSNAQWKDINAVKNNKVYINPQGVYLWSVRSGEAALQPLWTAKSLHPDMFTNVDMNKETKNFYKTYYNYNLTDDEVNSILNPTK
ncbi:ABC transporter substrate-binding protein [Clostridium sp.]|jgi:iron complex transport system substrate-binding protein|uniref:ABC transporter substrate-binding protein n=1 Tax=Clostridium sp. TaxID=1506 RepID=UPI0025912BC8|nr:ABC transporter substrate-binding protein [Clostridium sp.]MDF2505393.1 yhfQ 1 [Clostridium sp.]